MLLTSTNNSVADRVSSELWVEIEEAAKFKPAEVIYLSLKFVRNGPLNSMLLEMETCEPSGNKALKISSLVNCIGILTLIF